MPETPLDAITQRIRDALTAKQTSRDRALQLSRATIRYCANSIRATHRGDDDQARALLGKAQAGVQQLSTLLQGYPDLRHTGFVDDAHKEFAEASATRAIVLGLPLPSPEELGVDDAPYLNALGETAGELRRFLLDSIRLGRFHRCEGILQTMNEIYEVLVSMDFPDAMTGGLRRTTDMVRGVLERTRGDLTLALRQRDLTDRLDALLRRSPD